MPSGGETGANIRASMRIEESGTASRRVAAQGKSIMPNSNRVCLFETLFFRLVSFFFKQTENSEGKILKKTIFESIDYNLVPKDVWDLLHSWYGGGPAFPRTVEMVGYGIMVCI